MHPIQRAKLGFLIPNLGTSELVVNILYRGMNHSDDIDTIAFFEKITKICLESTVGRMHIFEAYGFDGTTIATDISTAAKLIRFPTPNPKIFFLNDLEWIRFPQKNYELFAQIYRNPQLRLFCRSEEHKEMVERCWNVKVEKVVERYDFYTPELLSFYKELNKPLYGNRIKEDIKINEKSLNI